MTARDFAQTLQLCERFGIEPHGRRAPPRRTRHRQGARARVALGRAGALGARAGFDLAIGHGSNDLTVAAALLRIPSLDRVRLRVGDRAAQRQLPPRAGGRRPGRDPARAAAPLRRRPAQAAPVPGPEGGVLPGRLRARRPRCSASWASSAQRPLAVVRTPPAVSLYHRFENDLFARVLRRLRERRPGRGPPAHARAAGRAGRRAAASSSPSARSTPSRWSPTPTSWCPPAGR